jgi:predicted TIM-barrel fold metal-dependent hydrolase
MQRLGYTGAGVMSWNVVSGDTLGGNEAVRQALQVFPNGYWGAASFDPVHYSQDDLKRLIPAMYADRRFIGMKPYLFGIRYDSPLYDCWWQYGNANRLYALIHRSVNDCSEVDNLAGRYPDVAWVIAHSGAGYGIADSVIACARKHPNVYAEITLTPLTAGVVEYLVAGMGEDRVLYGSDLPMRDPRQQLGWVLYARLSPTVKTKVLGLNTLNILKRSGRYPRSR